MRTAFSPEDVFAIILHALAEVLGIADVVVFIAANIVDPSESKLTLFNVNFFLGVTSSIVITTLSLIGILFPGTETLTWQLSLLSVTEMAYIFIVWFRTSDIARFTSALFFYPASYFITYIVPLLLIAQSAAPLIAQYAPLPVPSEVLNGLFGVCLFVLVSLDVAMIVVFFKFSRNSCVRDEGLRTTARYGCVAVCVSSVHPMSFLAFGTDGPRGVHWDLCAGVGMVAFVIAWGAFAKMKWVLQRADAKLSQEAQVLHAMETTFDRVG